jgi:hypothetical protein
MQFSHLATVSLALDSKTQWIWFSNLTQSFIVGDERRAFALPVASANASKPLRAERELELRIPPLHPCNLPIPSALYDEFASELWHGFRFLEEGAYTHTKNAAGETTGDLLRTLVFGPDYGHFVLHPSSGLILSLRSGSMELLRREGDEFKMIDKTRTRGRAALAFAAHPSEPMVVYGDNYGTFHAHRFDDKGFSKASKIVAKERKASRLEFTSAGAGLIVGGMGYLSAFSYGGGKFAPTAEVSTSVRDFVCLNDGKSILVNQGMNGIAAFGFGASGFVPRGAIKPSEAVKQICVSRCGNYLAATGQESSNVGVFSISTSNH